MEQRDSGQSDRQVERLAFSVPEVAEMLGISRATAYAYVRDGLIRAVVLRGRIVIPRRVIDELLSLDDEG